MSDAAFVARVAREWNDAGISARIETRSLAYVAPPLGRAVQPALLVRLGVGDSQSWLAASQLGALGSIGGLPAEEVTRAIEVADFSIARRRAATFGSQLASLPKSRSLFEARLLAALDGRLLWRLPGFLLVWMMAHVAPAGLAPLARLNAIRTRFRQHPSLTGPSTARANAVISATPDFQPALEWFGAMDDFRTKRNADTYAAVVAKAPTYSEAARWLETQPIQAPATAFRALFSKDLRGTGAADLLSWYWRQPGRKPAMLSAAIQSYARAGLWTDALKVALHYPHLSAAADLFRQDPTRAIVYFSQVLAAHPQHPDANYALGMAFLAAGRQEAAVREFRLALVLRSQHRDRKSVIAGLINDFG